MELIDEQSTYPSLLGGIDMGTGLLITVCVGLAASLTLLALSVWAGWFLMGSAVVIPALLGLVQFVIRENQNEAIPAVALIATYSVPMVVMSALLILSGSTLRRATATTAAHTHAAPSRRASLHEHGT